MNLTYKQIGDMVGLNVNSIRIYLSRAEFARLYKRRGTVYGIENKDIYRIRQLAERKHR